MSDKSRYKSSIGFTDMLFNILVGFAFLFIVAFLLIKPEDKKEDFERRAEFVVVMEWDHDQPDDIDLYVRDPIGKIASFRTPNVNFMHLDKDDLGYANDVVMNKNGVVSKININREVITIRGIIPGEYIVNAHYYSTRRIEKAMSVLRAERAGEAEVIEHDRFLTNSGQAKAPVTVKIEVHKVNPYKILWMGELPFGSRGQEETFVRFTVDKMGNLVGGFSSKEQKFVVPSMMEGGGPNGAAGNVNHYDTEPGPLGQGSFDATNNYSGVNTDTDYDPENGDGP